jgi:hypothetical protein
LVNKKILKNKIMPGTYGLTRIGLDRSIRKSLESEEEWKNLDKEEKKHFIAFIDKQGLAALGDEGIMLQRFLEICKKIAFLKSEDCQ